MDNWIYNEDTNINTQYKSYADSHQLKKITHYHKNEWHHEHEHL